MTEHTSTCDVTRRGVWSCTCGAEQSANHRKKILGTILGPNGPVTLIDDTQHIMEPEDQHAHDMRKLIGQLRDVLQCLRRGEIEWPIAIINETIRDLEQKTK